jgi:hypothetical protein
MGKAPLRYVRVYHELMDDPRFAEVYGDDAALALWLRLLLLADAIWPQSPHLPAGYRRRALDLLVRAGLVELVPGRRYRIHGLDRERQARSEQARHAVNVRWTAQKVEGVPRHGTDLHAGNGRVSHDAGYGRMRREEKRRVITESPNGLYRGGASSGGAPRILSAGELLAVARGVAPEPEGPYAYDAGGLSEEEYLEVMRWDASRKNGRCHPKRA